MADEFLHGVELKLFHIELVFEQRRRHHLEILFRKAPIVGSRRVSFDLEG